VAGRSGQLGSNLLGRVREEVSAGASRNRFVDRLEAGGVPRDRLTWLAGEQFRIVGSDQRSFALLAARFPDPPSGEMFLSLAHGELRALRLLSDFAAALGWGERELRAYEPRPLAQAYPAYLAWSALFGTCSGVALAMLANLEEWGGYCGRVAEALVARYDLPERGRVLPVLRRAGPGLCLAGHVRGRRRACRRRRSAGGGAGGPGPARVRHRLLERPRRRPQLIARRPQG